jgi:integrase/recombinase XerD
MRVRTAIDTWLLDLRAENKSPGTIEWYKHKLGYFADWLERGDVGSVDHLNADHVKGFLHYLQTLDRAADGRRAFKGGKVSSLTAHGYAQVIRTFGRWLVRIGYAERDPFDGVRMPKVDQYVIAAFTAEDLRQMLNAARHGRNADRNFTMILVLYDTAIRAGELASLTLGQVDFKGGWLRIKGKGAKERLVPMGAASKRALWRYVKEARPEPLVPAIDNVFLNERREPMTLSGVWRVVRETGDKAGIIGKRLSPHTIRHAAAEDFLRNGGDAFALQKLLGHTTLTVTRMYVDLVSKDL